MGRQGGRPGKLWRLHVEVPAEHPKRCGCRQPLGDTVGDATAGLRQSLGMPKVQADNVEAAKNVD
eukprot:2188884-Lingulodinium_polyedra.AAC.1